MTEFPESNQMYILGGRLQANHTASSERSGPPGRMTSITKIEVTARIIEDLHLIGYVLAALAVADLPGKKWSVHHDGGSARFVYVRESNELNTGSVVQLWDTLRALAEPTMEIGCDTH